MQGLTSKDPSRPTRRRDWQFTECLLLSAFRARLPQRNDILIMDLRENAIYHYRVSEIPMFSRRYNKRVEQFSQVLYSLMIRVKQ